MRNPVVKCVLTLVGDHNIKSEDTKGVHRTQLPAIGVTLAIVRSRSRFCIDSFKIKKVKFTDAAMIIQRNVNPSLLPERIKEK
jgi:hypothetical protein